MHKLKIGVLIVLLLFQAVGGILFADSTGAVSSPGIVVSQVQAGASGAATQEFISLFNNSDEDIDVTGWCLTNKSAVEFVCVPATPNVAVFVQARSHMTITSDSFSAIHNYQADIQFTTTNHTSGSIVGGSDTISVVDIEGVVIDSMNWTNPLAAGSVWQRMETVEGSGILLDTDSPADFVKLTSLLIPDSGIYEVETIVDVCPNIEDIQIVAPADLVIDASGECSAPPPVDACPNIGGIQIELPFGYLKDSEGNCQLDQCLDIDGLQLTIPDGYESLDAMNCTSIPLAAHVIEVTELLPNPLGTDAGNEFIEIYNPNNYVVDLTGYRFLFGANLDKEYSLQTGAVSIGPREYVTLGNAEIGFTLVNTTSRLRIIAPAGNIVSDIPQYSNPADGESWALFDGAWQYTNQPTPGSVNVGSIYDEDEEAGRIVTVAPCPEGKYRNPLTNRCRNIESDVSVLSSCDADQYRSPETGRCRKITLATALAPCKDGQYRSEETNRCRNISTAAATLTPCKEGQERNPETNRCRNVVASSVPAAAFAVEPVKQGAEVFVGWWALAAVILLAIGYGIWEWRFEIANLGRKLVAVIAQK